MDYHHSVTIWFTIKNDTNIHYTFSVELKNFYPETRSSHGGNRMHREIKLGTLTSVISWEILGKSFNLYIKVWSVIEFQKRKFRQRSQVMCLRPYIQEHSLVYLPLLCSPQSLLQGAYTSVSYSRMGMRPNWIHTCAKCWG